MTVVKERIADVVQQPAARFGFPLQRAPVVFMQSFVFERFENIRIKRATRTNTASKHRVKTI